MYTQSSAYASWQTVHRLDKRTSVSGDTCDSSVTEWLESRAPSLNPRLPTFFASDDKSLGRPGYEASEQLLLYPA